MDSEIPFQVTLQIWVTSDITTNKIISLETSRVKEARCLCCVRQFAFSWLFRIPTILLASLTADRDFNHGNDTADSKQQNCFNRVRTFCWAYSVWCLRTMLMLGRGGTLGAFLTCFPYCRSLKVMIAWCSLAHWLPIAIVVRLRWRKVCFIVRWDCYWLPFLSAVRKKIIVITIQTTHTMLRTTNFPSLFLRHVLTQVCAIVNEVCVCFWARYVSICERCNFVWYMARLLKSLFIFTCLNYYHRYSLCAVSKLGSSKANKMGKVASPSPSVKLGKMTTPFTANISSKSTFVPEGLGRPFYTPKIGVSYRWSDRVAQKGSQILDTL